MLISCIINIDTRAEKQEQGGLFAGVVNEDFLTHGIANKIAFLNGFEKEIIVHVDQHNIISNKALEYLRLSCDTLIIRKHTTEEKFNDYNYLRGLSVCNGDIIMHFDGDMAAFTSSKEAVQELIDLTDKYTFVSYPSPHSPLPAHDPNYNYTWCSTRFFVCKREAIDITEIDKCLKDMDYLYGKYPASVKNPWLEHCLGLHAKYNGTGVYYPPIEGDKLLMWCWDNYYKGVLAELNQMSYEEIKQFVISKNGIFYPNNLRL